METGFLLELSLILVVTKLFGLFSRRFHLPQVIGALLGGLILGPALLGILELTDTIEVLAEVGVILLMFTAGLETDLKQLKQSFKSSLVIAALGAVLPFGGGFLISHFFGMPLLESMFFGLILMATSVSITVETLQEMGKLKTRAGTAILGSAVIDDILGVVILSIIISTGTGAEASLGSVAITLLKIGAFFIFALGCGVVIFKLFENLTKNHRHRRRLSIFALAFCFFLAYLAERLGVADITGAYVAGLALCNCKAEQYIEQKTSVLSYMFFSPIFFISIGLNASFDGFDGRTLLFAVGLLIIALLSKVIGCGAGARLCRYTKKESLQIGMGMVSRGEVALIIASKGLVAGLIAPQFFSAVIIVVLVTTLLTPLLLKAAFADNRVQIVHARSIS